MGWWDKMLGSPELQAGLAEDQTEAQLEAVSMQMQAAQQEALLKYNPELIAQRRKTTIAVIAYILIGAIVVFLIIRLT